MEMLPEWEITSEYASTEASDFAADFAAIEKLAQEIHSISKDHSSLWSKTQWSSEEKVQLVQSMVDLWTRAEKAWILSANIGIYCQCLTSVDANDAVAEKWSSRIRVLMSDLHQAYTPAELWMMRSPQAICDEILQRPELKAWQFHWQQKRLTKDLLLGQDEEILISSLGVSGHDAWGDLYSKITGTMVCEVEIDGKIERVGIANAQAMTKLADPVQRKAAWLAIQKAWGAHKESAAAVLNALAGWRLELVKKRSHTRETNFLEAPLRAARTEEKTLNAMMTAIQENTPRLQKTLGVIARVHGQKKMQVWDLLAPAPQKAGQQSSMSFAEGFEILCSSLNEVSPELTEFVQMMREKKWIEARVLPRKSGGAYCTGFPKSKTPRVFQTWMGSFTDLTTLAHELGHAYHAWVMNDVPFMQADPPMTLAETASIFTETVLMDAMIQSPQLDAQSRFEASYGEAENAVGLLLNIPARFDFEKSFYEKRKKSIVTSDELSQLTDQAWSKWYGDALEQNDKLFWATKLHFSISGLSFYNFPYSFGYLFSLGIYARRQEWGPDFMKKYQALLRDTGRMTAEDLVQKHLGEDLGSVAFWRKSIEVVNKKLDYFEHLANTTRL